MSSMEMQQNTSTYKEQVFTYENLKIKKMHTNTIFIHNPFNILYYVEVLGQFICIGTNDTVLLIVGVGRLVY